MVPGNAGSRRTFIGGKASRWRSETAIAACSFQIIGRAEAYYSDGAPALFLEAPLGSFRPPAQPR